MPPTADVNIADDIVVTTATQSEDHVRARFEAQDTPAAAEGTEPTRTVDADADGTTTIAPGVKRQAESADDASIEREAESGKPDNEVSEAARKLRSSRYDVRLRSIGDDIALHEDTIRRLGGHVRPLEKRTYPNRQAEVDAMTRHRGDLMRDINRLLRQPAPAARPAAQPADDPTRRAAPAAPAAPKFEFPTFEAWQERQGNEEKSLTDYMDERQDARQVFLDTQRATEARARAVESARKADADADAKSVEEFKTHEAAFAKDVPDYYDTLAAAALPNLPDNALTFMDRHVRQAYGKDAPAVLHYCATHATEVNPRLEAARNPAELMAAIARIAGIVEATPRTAAPADDKGKPAVATPPSKPTTAAPAPVSEVRGSAQSGRSLQSLAEDSEDADAYIAQRQPHLLKHKR